MMEAAAISARGRKAYKSRHKGMTAFYCSPKSESEMIPFIHRAVHSAAFEALSLIKKTSSPTNVF